MKIGVFQFSLFGINTYVVFDPATLCCAVIDPGMFNETEEKAMENFITKNNLKVTHVINTHLHLDHAAGNSFMKKKYGVPVAADKNDEYLGSNIQQQARMFGLDLNLEDVEITQYLHAGEKIKIGEGELEVISVPGHSKGSIALYDKEDNFVIVGDALFQGSIGRTDLPGGDYEELIGSIKNNLLTLPESTIVFPGHGPSTTIGEEKKRNPFLR